VNLIKRGEMDVDLPTLFYAVGWSFMMRFLGSPLLVEGIRQIDTRWRDRDALGQCCVPPSTHKPASSTTSSITMASNLMLQRFKLGGVAGVLKYEWLLYFSNNFGKGF
jgi:hypothetical protein